MPPASAGWLTVMTDDLVLTPPRDDLALTAARFGAALRAEGVPADPGRCERFARAVTVARPTSSRALYLCALATLISSQAHIEALDRVFGEMFGSFGDDTSGHQPPGVPDADARPCVWRGATSPAGPCARRVRWAGGGGTGAAAPRG